MWALNTVIVVSFLVGSIYGTDTASEVTCMEENPCNCTISNGLGEFNLFNWHQWHDGNPKVLKAALSERDGEDIIEASYFPCKVHVARKKYEYYSSRCEQSELCLEIKGRMIEFWRKVKAFWYEREQLILEYINDHYNINVTIFIHCDMNAEDPIFAPRSRNSSQNWYKFDVKSKCGCPNKCPLLQNVAGPNGGVNSSASSNLSTGSVIVIVFVSLIAFYVVAGVTYNKFVKGAHGREIIPNYEFWKKMPDTVMDGVKFTVSRPRKSPAAAGQPTYDSI